MLSRYGRENAHTAPVKIRENEILQTWFLQKTSLAWKCFRATCCLVFRNYGIYGPYGFFFAHLPTYDGYKILSCIDHGPSNLYHVRAHAHTHAHTCKHFPTLMGLYFLFCNNCLLKQWIESEFGFAHRASFRFHCPPSLQQARQYMRIQFFEITNVTQQIVSIAFTKFLKIVIPTSHVSSLISSTAFRWPWRGVEFYLAEAGHSSSWEFQ